MSRLQFTIARWSFHINLHEYSIQHYLILVPGPGHYTNTSATHWNISEHLKKRQSSLWITRLFISSLISPPTTWRSWRTNLRRGVCQNREHLPYLLPPTSSHLGQTSTCVTNRQQNMLLKVNGVSQFTSSDPYICMPWPSFDRGQTSTCAIAELPPIFWRTLHRKKTSRPHVKF